MSLTLRPTQGTEDEFVIGYGDQPEEGVDSDEEASQPQRHRRGVTGQRGRGLPAHRRLAAAWAQPPYHALPGSEEAHAGPSTAGPHDQDPHEFMDLLQGLVDVSQEGAPAEVPPHATAAGRSPQPSGPFHDGIGSPLWPRVDAHPPSPSQQGAGPSLVQPSAASQSMGGAPGPPGPAGIQADSDLLAAHMRRQFGGPTTAQRMRIGRSRLAIASGAARGRTPAGQHGGATAMQQTPRTGVRHPVFSLLPPMAGTPTAASTPGRPHAPATQSGRVAKSAPERPTRFRQPNLASPSGRPTAQKPRILSPSQAPTPGFRSDTSQLRSLLLPLPTEIVGDGAAGEDALAVEDSDDWPLNMHPPHHQHQQWQQQLHQQGGTGDHSAAPEDWTTPAAGGRRAGAWTAPPIPGGSGAREVAMTGGSTLSRAAHAADLHPAPHSAGPGDSSAQRQFLKSLPASTAAPLAAPRPRAGPAASGHLEGRLQSVLTAMGTHPSGLHLPPNLVLSIEQRHAEGSVIKCRCRCQPPGGPGGAPTLVALFKAGTGSGLVLTPGSKVLVKPPYIVLNVAHNCPVIACHAVEQLEAQLHHVKRHENRNP